MKATKLTTSLRPKLVTFDVTGTLLNTLVEKHYVEIGAKHGINLTTPERLAPSFKQHFKRLSIEHPVFGKHTGLGWKQWWKSLVHNVFNDQNLNISCQKLDQISDSLIELYSTEKCWQKYPGTENLLHYLNDNKIIVGIISNFDERLEDILINTSIRKYFQFVLTSWEHGKEKPDISIFQEALKLGQNVTGKSIEPIEAIHVGDNLKLDYQGAKNAKWNCFLKKHKTDSMEKYKTIPDYYLFNDLYQLRYNINKIIK